MKFGRGVLYNPNSGVSYCNPITSLDNDPCALVILIHSVFLLSNLGHISYTLSIRSGNVFTTHNYTMGAEHAVKWAAYRLTATVLE
jgi:hypothetical protein